MQVEELFQAKQLKKDVAKNAATKQLAVLELKRATAIGIRMAGFKQVTCCISDLFRLNTRLLKLNIRM